MDRPNLATSPKAVQRYVDALETRLAQQASTIATLTRDATTTDDWRGPIVGYLNGGHREPRIPLTRVREPVNFIPHEDRSVNISVRWQPDHEALEVMDNSHRGALVLEPRAANVFHIRKGS